MNRFSSLILLCGIAIGSQAAASEPTILNVWPESVPGLRSDAAPERIENNRIVGVHYPTLSVYPPAADAPQTKTGVIFCPGGGYHHLTIGENGGPDTQWLNSLGVTVFILKYRMLEYGHPAPLQDVVQSVKLVRRDAERYGISADRIGVLGASAGGHVAAYASTLWEHPEANPSESIADISGRPDFAILVYPVITMREEFAHRGSRTNLIGTSPSADLIALTSLENQAHSDTPPTLIIATMADRSVPVENSLLYFQALRAQNVPTEMHIYAQGSHGNSLDPQYGPTALWPARAEEWLRFNGWLE